MPVAAPSRLQWFATELLSAAGVPRDRAEMVAEHLVSANAVGHDSHGLIRIPSYVRQIEEGIVHPDAPLSVTGDTDTTALVDGNEGLGICTMSWAADLAVGKARKAGVAAVGVRGHSHTGRLGWYSERIARQGMISLVVADSALLAKTVAPFGGTEARLGTNPLSFGFPSAGAPIVLDMATSAIARGKARVAFARKEFLSSEYIVDSKGDRTNDPGALEEGGDGALLPFGGDQAHKGYGLSIMVAILSGVLTGVGFRPAEEEVAPDCGFIGVLDVRRFRQLEDFQRGVASFADYLRETRPAKGSERVMVPGELEVQTETVRRRVGIYVEDATWVGLRSLGERYGVPLTG